MAPCKPRLEECGSSSSKSSSDSSSNTWSPTSSSISPMVCPLCTAPHQVTDTAQHTHTEHRGADKHRQTDRQTDRQTHRQTDTQTHRHTCAVLCCPLVPSACVLSRLLLFCTSLSTRVVSHEPLTRT